MTTHAQQHAPEQAAGAHDDPTPTSEPLPPELARALAAVTKPDELATLLVNNPSFETQLLHDAQAKLGNLVVVEAGEQAQVMRKSAELQGEHGVRPRKYRGLLNGSNAAEIIFRATIPEAVAFLNTCAAAQGFTFQISEAELVVNMIAEGAFDVLNSNYITGLGGFANFGLDTFYDRRAQLAPWLHPCVQTDRLQAYETFNEKGKVIHSVTDLTLVQGVYAAGAMYGLCKGMLDKDLRSIGLDMASLPAAEVFYWITRYFNTGDQTASKALKADKGHGVDEWKTKWTKEDSHDKYKMVPQYNAVGRMATYELAVATYMPGGKLGAAMPLDAVTQQDLEKQCANIGELLGYLNEELKQEKDAHRKIEVEHKIERADELVRMMRAHLATYGATTTTAP